MKVEIAFNTDETRKLTFQSDFSHVTRCCYCEKRARLGFVAHELDESVTKKGGKYVCHLWDNKPKQMWLHDACAVAVYFCEDCLKPTALYNQG